MFFMRTISRKATAHRFSPPGYPGGIEGYLFPKSNTFQNRRKEEPGMAVFRIEKSRDYTAMFITT